MGSDNEAQVDVQFKPANRRDHAAAPTVSNRGDACGRARLFILAIFAFLILYITIASTQVDLPQIIVRVPPDENEGNHFRIPQRSLRVYFCLLFNFY